MSIQKDEDFEKAVSKAKKYPEPKRTKELRKIIKRRFTKEGFSAAVETAKELGHYLSEDECIKIIEKLICP